MAAEKATTRKPDPPIGKNRKAILKSQIQIAIEGAGEYIDALAAYVKDKDAPLVPLQNVKLTLQRGQHVIDAALRLMEEN